MQKPDMTRLVEFLEPLNKVISKASTLTEGRRSDYFHHTKTGADSLAALAWIAYTGKDCGIKTCLQFINCSFGLFTFLQTIIYLPPHCRYEHAYSTRGRKLANG